MVKPIILKPILIAYYVAVLVNSLDYSSTQAINNTGFSIDLIHRDSLQSPFHNPSLSPPQRRLYAIRRSFHSIRRVNTYKRPTQSPQTEITNSYGEYLMKYSVGTPPVPTLGLIDTGSDLIWTQCRPCLQCFNQKLTIFTPNKSYSYKRIPCKASTCTSFMSIKTSCSNRMKNCLYSETFDDGSFTMGEISTDTLSFPSTSGKRVISAPNIIIGCGFNNNGIFVAGESGVVGLGGGKVSLVRQLGFLAQGKFSYCLVPLIADIINSNVNSGKLNFGGKATVSGKGVVSTPLVPKYPQTYYYLTLEGISVGNKKLDLFDDPLLLQANSIKGNMMIDSGTTLTFLPNSLYTNLVKALRSSIKLKTARDPLGVLDLCFFTRKDIGSFPPLVFHFEGADVKLKQDNVFFRTSHVSLCLAAMPVPDNDIGIYGNMAQINFLVGYDLEKRTVSFKPTHCSKL